MASLPFPAGDSPGEASSVEAPLEPLSVLGPPADAPQRLTVRENVFARIGVHNDYSALRDHRHVWHIEGKAPSLHHKMKVRDVRSGDLVARMQRHLVSLAPIYHIYGGDGTERAWVRKRLFCMFRPTYDLFLLPRAPRQRRQPAMTVQSGSMMELDWKFTGSPADHSPALPAPAGAGPSHVSWPPLPKRRPVIARAHHTFDSIIGGKDRYELTVAAGVDALMIVCLMCCIDDAEDSERARC